LVLNNDDEEKIFQI
jgi:hypothetical protein